nr:putative adenylate cyclase regulatory protein isoform X3 [Ipomoea batatas]
MQCLSSLVNLVKLDLERCPRIHGGLVHIEGLTRLESLTIRCCKCIVDSDMKSLAGLVNLKQLQTPCVNITDSGVFYLKGLRKLVLLNMEGCHITAACLEYLSGFLLVVFLCFKLELKAMKAFNDSKHVACIKKNLSFLRLL